MTFDGVALYRFTGDTKAGQAKGQGVESKWFAVLKSGIPATAHVSTTTAPPSTTTPATAPTTVPAATTPTPAPVTTPTMAPTTTPPPTTQPAPTTTTTAPATGGAGF